MSTKFWKSHNFKSFLNGLALGDVDKDGKVETVIAGAHSIRIYRYENRRLIKIEEIQESKYLYFIGIDIADINQNGYPEIFVTSLTSGKNSVSSFVLEYNGKKYVKIVDDVPWYFRVVKMPDKRPILLGTEKYRRRAFCCRGNSSNELGKFRISSFSRQILKVRTGKCFGSRPGRCNEQR